MNILCKLYWIQKEKEKHLCSFIKNAQYMEIIRPGNTNYRERIFGGTDMMRTELYQVQKIQQKMILTQSMYQSLDVLQMALPELRTYINDQVLSNPLLEMDDSQSFASLDSYADDADVYEDPEVRESSRIEVSGRALRDDPDHDRFEHLVQPVNDLRNDLKEQLMGIKGIDKVLRSLCEYLIDCLDEKGFLPFDTEEIADELKIPEPCVRKALHLLQQMEPAGIGARDLSGCLLLQLEAKGVRDSIYELMIGEGLSMIADMDENALMRLTGRGRREVIGRMEMIKSLNPCPANGYAADGSICYRVPEATIKEEDGKLVIIMNRSFLPKIELNHEVKKLLESSTEESCREYLKNNLDAAKKLGMFVEKRTGTIESLLKMIIQVQEGYFLRGEPLKPMTMRQAADALGISISTISRAISGKTVIWNGRVVVLRELFSTGIQTVWGESVTADIIKIELHRIIREENPSYPLSDKQICELLEYRRITVSRRTVAKYRQEMNIPSSAMRKVEAFAI